MAKLILVTVLNSTFQTNYCANYENCTYQKYSRYEKASTFVNFQVRILEEFLVINLLAKTSNSLSVQY